MRSTTLLVGISLIVGGCAPSGARSAVVASCDAHPASREAAGSANTATTGAGPPGRPAPVLRGGPLPRNGSEWIVIGAIVSVVAAAVAIAVVAPNHRLQ